MAKPLLIIVSGASASEKTVLSRRLSADLSVPLIGKDSVKELLFDIFPQYDREWSRAEGRVAVAMMYAGAGELLRLGYHVMIESSFHAHYSRDDISKLFSSLDVDIYEIHCEIDESLRQKRWSQRSLTERHPAHLDNPDQLSQLTDANAAIFPEHARYFDTGLSAEKYEHEYCTIKTELADRLDKGGFYATTN